MLRRTLFAITMFSVLPAIGTVSQAVAADRGLCFKEQKAVIGETCYNPLPRRTFQFGGQQNGAGQPHDFPGGHGGKFPGSHDGKLDGPQGGDNPGGGGGGPQPG